MKRLDGKVALISGGTTGLGAAAAKLFRAEGATVVVTGSNPDTLEAARRELDGIEVIDSDAADTKAITALVAAMKDRHGRIDVLFVNAGVAKNVSASEVDEQFFDRMFDINVRGAYFLIKAAAPVIPDGGSIVLTSSIGHARGVAGFTVYAASKAAVRSFARTFAAELAPRKIRVNAISPGPIETPIWEKMGTSVGKASAMRIQMESRIPLKRIGRPEDVANAALFLASDESSFTTGADFPVDGGVLDLG